MKALTGIFMKISCILIVLLSFVGQAYGQLPKSKHLSYWYIGDSVVTSSSNIVDTLKDNSQNGNPAVQTNLSFQPQQNSRAELNNHKVISFNGSSDFLTNSAPFGTPFTLFFISAQNPATGDGYQHIIEPDGGGNSQWLYHNGFYEWYNTNVQSGTFSTSAFHIMSLTQHKDSVEFYLDTLINSKSNLNPILSGTGWTIGADNSNTPNNEHLNGDIAEIIMYDTLLDKADLSQVYKYLRNKYATAVSLGPDITYGFCDTLNAGNRFVNYKWSTGETTASISVSKTGTYWVQVQDVFGFSSSDTINVTIPSVNVIRDTSICPGNTLVWNTNLPNTYTFLWQDGITTSSLFPIKDSGNYNVVVKDAKHCSVQAGPFHVGLDSYQDSASLGASSVSMCAGNSIALTKGAKQAKSYLWSDLSTNPDLSIQNSGQYMLTVIDSNGCIAKDTINVTINGKAPTANFTHGNHTCLGDSVSFMDLSNSNDSSPITSWLWNFGDGQNSNDSTPKHLYSLPKDTGLINVGLMVTTLAGCPSNNTVIKMHIYPKPNVNFSVSPICCGYDAIFTNIPDLTAYPAKMYSWNFADTSSGFNNLSSIADPQHNFNSPGPYNVKLIITNDHGCADSISKLTLIADDEMPQHNHISFWYMGDSVRTSNSNKIDTVMDNSGNGKVAVQTNLSFQPLQNSRIELNSHNVISFNGLSDFLTNTASFGNPLTLFFISKQANPSVGDGYQHIFEPDGGGTSQWCYFGGGYEWFNTNVQSQPFSTTSFHILSLTQHKDSVVFYLDTVKNASSQSNPILSGTGWTIGWNNNQSPLNHEYLNGDIAEIIMFDTLLKKSDISQVYKYLRNKYAPPVDLGPDITYGFCDSLKTGNRFVKYKWSTGDTTGSISVSKTGTYWVKVQDVFGFSSSDTINVTTPPLHVIRDTSICPGNILIWNTQLPNTYTFLWQDGKTTSSSFSIKDSGNFYVVVKDSKHCSVQAGPFHVSLDSYQDSASLGASALSLCAGNSIALTKGAKQAKSYLWSDGSSDSSLIVQKSDTFSLIVTDVNGCIAMDTIKVTINGKAPTANFKPVSLTCGGDSVIFNDLSKSNDTSSLAAWSWNFGDGQHSTSSSPAHLYSSPSDTGLFIVKLKVTTLANCSSNDTSFKLHVYPKPSKVYFSNTNPCSADSIQFTSHASLHGYSIQNYSWNFGNGSADTSINIKPYHKFPGVNTDSVKLILTNDHGCKGDTTIAITINPSPVAGFYMPKIACDSLAISLVDSTTSVGFLNATVYYGDGSKGFSNPLTPHTYALPNVYQVKYIIKDFNGCSDTFRVKLPVYSKPIANFSITPPYCVNSPINFLDNSKVIDTVIAADNNDIDKWNWTFDTSITSVSKNPTLNFIRTGTNQSAKLKVTSAHGCVDSLTKFFPVFAKPSAAFTLSPLYGSPPLLVSFTQTDITKTNTYSWNFGDNSAPDSAINPTHIYPDSNKYFVTLMVTDTNGCSFTSPKSTVEVTNAFYDVVLTNVTAYIDADYFIHTTISFYNNSNRPLTVADFVVDIENDPGFMEEWDGNLAPGQSVLNYPLKTTPRLNPSYEHTFVCVTARRPDGFTDANLGNDKMCYSLNNNQFGLPDPNPNPTMSTINLPFVIPADGTVGIAVFDKLGKLIFNNSNYSASKGYNNVVFYANSLAQGMYTYRITYKTNQGVKKFIKIGN